MFTILLILKGNMRVRSSQPVENPTMENKSIPWIRSVFCYLKCCMETEECKNNITERKRGDRECE